MISSIFFKFIKSPFRYLLLGFLFLTIINQLTDIAGIIIPIKSSERKGAKCLVEKNLRDLGAPGSQLVELSYAVKLASESTNLNEELIVAIIKTESDFKRNAISSKNYKGLMQTPSATFIYVDVDVLHGARILKDKLKTTNGNLLQALTLYKGGNNPVARRYAFETLNLYEKLLNQNNKGVKT